MTVGSLFAGIGGLELGLERAGMEVRWQVEVDPFCRRVLEKHWPRATRYDDVRDAAGLPWVDLICGGFPCQDIASAGTRLGLDGERSGLWRQMLRLVREIQPRYVVVENVADLLSGPDGTGGWFATLLGDLAESGYDAEWNSLPAGAFGAPHRRERVFVVAYPCGQPSPQAIAAPRAVRSLRQARHHDGGRTWNGKPRAHRRLGPSELLRVDDGFPDRVDACTALGNAVVPQVAEWIGRRIMDADQQLREAA